MGMRASKGSPEGCRGWCWLQHSCLLQASGSNPFRLLALPATGRVALADLLVSGVDGALIKALNKRAGARARSAEADQRSILAAVLVMPPRRALADRLASMPDVGRNEDFERQVDEARLNDWCG